MVFNTTFNNISVIMWQSVILAEETENQEKKEVNQKKSYRKLYLSTYK
jgi:hypothetical protein